MMSQLQKIYIDKIFRQHGFITFGCLAVGIIIDVAS